MKYRIVNNKTGMARLHGWAVEKRIFFIWFTVNQGMALGRAQTLAAKLRQK